MSESKADQIAKILARERQALAESQRIHQKDFEHLAYSAYCLGTISGGKGRELLGLALPDFEAGFRRWLEEESEWYPELIPDYEERQKRDNT